MLLILVVSHVYQVQFVVAYAAFQIQAKTSNKSIAKNSLTLLGSNVRMNNGDNERFYARVKKYNPDILLNNKPDPDEKVIIREHCNRITFS